MKNKRIPACKNCGRRNWRKQGLVPTNLAVSSKGWHGEKHPNYHKEAVARLYHKRYICKHCGTRMNYGNAGRPI